MTRDMYTKRPATEHGYLPCLLGDGDKGMELVYGEEKIFCSGPTRAAKAEQTQLTNQERTPLFVLFEPPFASVLTVSRSHLSQVSLGMALRQFSVFSKG